MPKTKTSEPKSKAGPSADSEAPPRAPSLAAGFARFLPLAQQLPAERVLPLRQDVNLIFANVQTGLTAVLPHQARLKTELPMLRVDQFSELAELADALMYAAAQALVAATPMRRDQIDKLFVRLHVLREAMLTGAEMLALMDLLPKQRVEQIRSGRGAFDAAQDGVALADLYTEYAAVVANKHPFTSAHLGEIAELGHTLMRVVTPDGARGTPSAEQAAATQARDRLYTLLLERHTDLRRAGFYLFGEEVDEKVPALGARKGRSRSTATTPAPQPLPAPATDPAAAAH